MEKYSVFKFAKQADINVGLIGAGIRESRSPLMHIKEASAQGTKLHYQLFDLDLLDNNKNHLPGLLDAIESAGYAGLNITHPCKQSVIEFLDDLSPDARDLGAVNTVCFTDGKRFGHNTDWQGFYLSFTNTLPKVKKETVFQLGAGGAGSAVAYALAKSGVKSLHLYDLDKNKAQDLLKRLSGKFKDTSFIFTNNPASTMV
ncbi:MAG: shikimate dehydrogenase, partial [Gammaproteobacteria bacterium]|nr:shikimate dehydrogenase [Gammaproteobacteria bacterium]